MGITNVTVTAKEKRIPEGSKKEAQVWQVVKDGNIFEVTDSNGNGYIDENDMSKCLSGSASLNRYDIIEAWKQSCDAEGGKGMSLADMARYDEVKEQYQAEMKEKEAKESATKTTKKENWFTKGLSILGSLTMPVGLALTGIGLAKGIGKDPYTGASWTMAGASLMSLGAMNQMTSMVQGAASKLDMNSLGATNTFANAASMIPDMSALTAQAQAAIAPAQAAASTGGCANGNCNNPKQVIAKLLKLAEQEESLTSTINPKNIEWIKEHIDEDTTELEKEDLAIANRILANPNINYTLSEQLEKKYWNTIPELIFVQGKTKKDNQPLASEGKESADGTTEQSQYERFMELISKEEDLTDAEKEELNKLIDTGVPKIKKYKTEHNIT